MLKKKESFFMMLTVKEKIEIARYRMEKAKRPLGDADTLFQSSSFESSINRGYYAILNASRSLLILRGIEAETHEGIKTMLSKEFIKTGLLPKEFGETFRSVQARRLDSDYGDYVEIGQKRLLIHYKEPERLLQRRKKS